MYSSQSSAFGIDTQVLICGGGPAGLTLAVVLRQHGISCRIVDRDPQDHMHSRGKGVQPRTLEVFDDLGIVDEVRAHGISSGTVRFYTNKQPVSEVVVPELAPRPGIPYPSLLIIPQFQTERVLHERLQDFGVTIERGRELVAFQDDGERVSATITDSATGAVEEVHAAYLVGCDGGRSFVRQQLGLRFEGENHEQYWALGDMEIEGLSQEVAAHAWFADDHSYLNATRLPGVKMWQVQASVRPNQAGQVETASVELFQRLFAERTNVPSVRVSNPTWLSNYNVKRRMVDRYRKGRVFVAGDAAHIHSPAGGQGLNTGVQDAYNLGWKLAHVLQGKANPALLNTYEEERLPVAQGVLRSSETGNSLFFSTNPFIALFRRFVLLPLLRQPRVTAALLLSTAGLALNYRGTSLAHEHRDQRRGMHGWFARSKLQAGDRAPDARMRDAHTGRPLRLFDAFRGPHWTLLLFAGATHQAVEPDRLTAIATSITATYGDTVHTYLIRPASAQSATPRDRTIPVLEDDREEAQALYGAQSGALVLVRPDGYIGVRGELAAEHDLYAYLNAVLRVPQEQEMNLKQVLA